MEDWIFLCSLTHTHTHTHTCRDKYICSEAIRNVAHFHNEVQEVKLSSIRLLFISPVSLLVVLLNPLHLHDLVFPAAVQKLIRLTSSCWIHLSGWRSVSRAYCLNVALNNFNIPPPKKKKKKINPDLSGILRRLLMSFRDNYAIWNQRGGKQDKC